MRGLKWIGIILHLSLCQHSKIFATLVTISAKVLLVLCEKNKVIMDSNMSVESLFPPLNLPFRHNFLCGQIYPPVGYHGYYIRTSAFFALVHLQSSNFDCYLNPTLIFLSNSCLLPQLIDGNEIHRTSNYDLRDDDVILVTYPKSGVYRTAKWSLLAHCDINDDDGIEFMIMIIKISIMITIIISS